MTVRENGGILEIQTTNLDIQKLSDNSRRFYEDTSPNIWAIIVGGDSVKCNLTKNIHVHV